MTEIGRLSKTPPSRPFPGASGDAESTPAVRPSLHRFGGPAAIAIASLMMLHWSWQTWPDPLVDFGAQLYVPWQLSTGHVLYRDVAYYNGPLSSYLNAAAFRLFGVGMSRLLLVNLSIVAAAMILAYRLTAAASGRSSALVAGLTFVLLFSFGQVVNYNWVTPYTHEVTHGAVLGLAALASVARYQQSKRIGWIITGGALLGAVLLTKAEPAAATVAAVGALLLGSWWYQKADVRSLLRSLMILSGCALVLPLSAWMLLSAAMPASQAFRGLLGSWPWLFDHRITSLHFYRDVAGLDDVNTNLRRMLSWAAAYAVVIASAVGAGLLCRSPRNRTAVSAIVFAISFIALGFNSSSINWTGMLTPLPLCLGLALIVTARAALRRSNERAPLRLALVVFASLLVAKLGLRAYAFHYGFVLAWPATAVLVCAVTQDLPAWVDSRGGAGRVVRAVGLAVWMVVLGVMLMQNARHLQRDRSIVAAGTTDEFRGDQRALEVQRICERINQMVPPDGTVMVLPQGLMINYLTRRATPTSCINFMPPEVIAAGEQNILMALRRHPPDAIVLTPAVIANGYFTLDDRDPYGAEVLKWVMQNYRPVDDAEAKQKLVMMVPRTR